MAIGTIVSGLLAGGTSLLTFFLESEDLERREAESKELSERSRKDELKVQRQAFDFAKEKFDFSKRESQLNRAERAEDRLSGKQATTFNNAISLFNQGVSLRDRNARLWGGD